MLRITDGPMASDEGQADGSRLLIIDDDPGAIQVLRRILSAYRHIQFANDGGLGIELARDDPPDLILLDFEMPGIDGAATLRALRADPNLADVPVIFVTAHDDAAIESEMLNLGAVDFLRKPPNPLVVNARVRTQLRLKAMTDQLRDLARRDGLTCIANRAAFEETLVREWRRSARERSALSLLLVDVDHFKSFNDTHGHLAGDGALRSVARCLDANARRGSDFVARYGGEEFAVLLPDTPAAAALERAEELRAAVGRLGLVHGASPVADHVTISIGVSTLLPGADGSGEVPWRTALIQGADEALYRAKRAGRNRVAARSFAGQRSADGEGVAAQATAR